MEESFGTTTYIDTLNAMMVLSKSYEGEYFEVYENVTVKDPESGEHKLSAKSEETQSFTYTVTTSGDYKFTATGSNERTSEITVAVEVTTPAFILVNRVYDETSSTYSFERIGIFEFEAGQTWADFIGEDETSRTINSIKFKFYDIDGVKYLQINCRRGRRFCLGC